MFHIRAATDHPPRAVAGPSTRPNARTGDTPAQRMAAERAVDVVLTDSFPASDPPSWTQGIARLSSATDDEEEMKPH